MTNRQIARRRAAVAYDVLRGRPMRPSYRILVVLPLVAAAAGSLIALGLETLMTRSRSAGPAAPVTGADLRSEPVGVR